MLGRGGAVVARPAGHGGHRLLARVRSACSLVLGARMGPLEIVACGTMLLPVLAVVGAGVGVVAGLMVGLTLGVAAAPLTLGFSMVLSPMSWIWLGAALGAFGACTCGARLCVLWVENALLYHPRPYYDGDPEEGVLYLGGEPYELEWVCCPLPVPRGPGGQPGGASPAPELHRSLLLRPQKWGASVMWVVFGGNAMLASDWYPFCNQLCRLQGRRGGASAAFLLFDFPGYGGNPGRTSPAATLTASLCSLRAALARFDAGPPEVNLLGHSLGAAAAAQLAAHLAITGAPAGRLVLSAPFTSIPHVAVHLLQRAAGFVWQRAAPPRLQEALLGDRPHGPLQAAGAAARGLLVAGLAAVTPHRWGNVAPVRAAARAGWQVGIIHGEKDLLVPAGMGRELHDAASAAALDAAPRGRLGGPARLVLLNGRSPAAAEASAASPLCGFVEVPGAHHGNSLLLGAASCAELMGLV